jgi:hypothetical protein
MASPLSASALHVDHTPSDILIAAMTATQPFRFLDLPTELRCLVYEQLDIRTRLHRLMFPYSSVPEDKGEIEAAPAILVAVKSLPVAILATCRLCLKEASPILEPKLYQLQYGEPLHLISDRLHAHTMINVFLALTEAFKNPPDMGEAITHATENRHARGLWNQTSDLDDAWHATYQEFLRKCASYVRLRPTGRMIVSAQRDQPHLSNAPHVSDMERGRKLRDLVFRLRWSDTAAKDLELRIFDFPANEEHIIRWIFRYPPLRKRFIAINERDWSNIWAGNEVVDVE